MSPPATSPIRLSPRVDGAESVVVMHPRRASKSVSISFSDTTEVVFQVYEFVCDYATVFFFFPSTGHLNILCLSLQAAFAALSLPLELCL